MTTSKTTYIASCLALCVAGGMSLSACGGGDSTDGGGSETSSDNGGGSQDTGGGNGGDTGTTQDAGTTDDGGTTSGGGKQVKEEFQSEGAQQTCSQNNPPSRCSADPNNFSDWGPASVLTDLKLFGEGVFTKEKGAQCCADLDKGDEKNDTDNNLGKLLDLFKGQFNANDEIDSAVENGELVLVTEHQGLEDTQNDDEFKINFYLAEYANQVNGKPSSGTEVNLEPASFDEGTQPAAQVAPASVESGNITGGPGRVSLSIDIPQIGSLSLDVNGARVKGSINQSMSDLDGNGVVIENGELSGYVRVRDVVGAVNNVLKNCGCLNNPDPSSNPVIEIANSDSSDPDLCPADDPDCDNALSCGTDNQSGTKFTELAKDCTEKDDGQACTFTGTICQAGGVIQGQTDLDTDADGTTDAISIGATFGMTGAKIQGVASSNSN